MAVFRKISQRLEILIFVFITLVLYTRVTGFDFVWDDISLIPNNPYFSQGFHWKDFFIGNLWKYSSYGTDLIPYYYRPLVVFSYFVEHKLWGFSPAGFHIANLFLHMIAIVLIWLLMIRLELNRSARMLGMFFYSLHPALVSCVAFISCHGDLLCQVFGLLALLFWMMKGKIKWLSLLWIFLAMLSKEAGVVLPLVIILLDILICLKPIKSLEKFIPMLLWVPYFFLRHFGMDHSVVATPNWISLSRNQGAFRTFSYISRIFFPVPSAEYGTTQLMFGIQNVGILVALLLMFGLLLWKTNTKQKFLIGWFLLTTIIIADWVNVGVRFSDQLLYIPLVPVAILFGTFVSKKKHAIYLSVPLFFCFLFITNSKIPIWRNNLVFWQNEIKYNPDNIGAKINYAVELGKNGYMQEACTMYQKVLVSLNERDDVNIHSTRLALYHLGNCFRLENPSLAERYYREALKVSPQYTAAKTNLIMSLLQQKKNREALTLSTQLVEEKGDLVLSWALHAYVLFKNEDYRNSLKILEKVIQMDPNDLESKKLMKEVQSRINQSNL